MNEAALKAVWEMRKSLRSIDDGTTAYAVLAFCLLASGVVGFGFGSLFGGGAGFCYGVGAFAALLFWIWLFIYARRAWLLARTAFEVMTCDVADEPVPEPAPAEPETVPEPATPPAVLEEEHGEAAGPDAGTLQAMLDARAASQ